MHSYPGNTRSSALVHIFQKVSNTNLRWNRQLSVEERRLNRIQRFCSPWYLPPLLSGGKSCHINLLKPYCACMTALPWLQWGPRCEIRIVCECRSLFSGRDTCWGGREWPTEQGVLQARLNNHEALKTLDIWMSISCISYPVLRHPVTNPCDWTQYRRWRRAAYKTAFLSSFHKRAQLDKEVDYMLQHKLAEPSNSSGSSPASKSDLLKGMLAGTVVSTGPGDKSVHHTSWLLFLQGHAFLLLRNDPNNSQQLMKRVGAGPCGDAVYLDDGVIFRNTWDEHLQKVRALADRLGPI